ncbi:energy-coupling factor ABC transporter substrate-binding protein [Candidatus Magnetominusculus xianensis]|uniref:Cobalamin biosynthesis protein CbiN n=1 Tax=Candidatus Magnetominusculus xianensis TaxID=1748249 RepID=A0ABR5SEM3_9BACT|nr:energy-coupling factor ABC transporter substrate-binding protein [Candidatus Magnetominusculus xianensis]KWT81197.1 cobalamin biosynthesis protein CbiN [Candidatus Magnetominusculus xianensis]MBF0404289.1 energy-coupling factor ABC transporter substrate-binding protein [Nitrospirota bacterium]
MFSIKNISLAVLLTIIALTPAIIYKTTDFMGSDDKGSTLVSEIAPSYVRWVEPFLSPTKGIETLGFVFQAAIGAGFIFFYIMRKRRKR